MFKHQSAGNDFKQVFQYSNQLVRGKRKKKLNDLAHQIGQILTMSSGSKHVLFYSITSHKPPFNNL
jgi:hypothetical protein